MCMAVSVGRSASVPAPNRPRGGDRIPAAHQTPDGDSTGSTEGLQQETAATQTQYQVGRCGKYKIVGIL